MGLGLVQHGSEKALRDLTARPGACGEGTKGMETGSSQKCLAGG